MIGLPSILCGMILSSFGRLASRCYTTAELRHFVRQAGQSPDRFPTSTGGHDEDLSALVLLAALTAVSLAQIPPAPGTPPGAQAAQALAVDAGADHVHDESGTSSRNDRFAGRDVDFRAGPLHVPRNGSVAAGSRSCESVASCCHQYNAALAGSAEAASGAVGNPQHAHPRSREHIRRAESCATRHV